MPKLTVYCVERLEVERLFWIRIRPNQKVSDATGSGSKILQGKQVHPRNPTQGVGALSQNSGDE
jgi:hypothetical protein